MGFVVKNAQKTELSGFMQPGTYVGTIVGASMTQSNGIQWNGQLLTSDQIELTIEDVESKRKFKAWLNDGGYKRLSEITADDLKGITAKQLATAGIKEAAYKAATLDQKIEMIFDSVEVDGTVYAVNRITGNRVADKERTETAEAIFQNLLINSGTIQEGEDFDANSQLPELIGQKLGFTLAANKRGNIRLQSTHTVEEAMELIQG